MQNLPESMQAPAPGAVLVLKRWNSWVQVQWPDGETAWVDLAETPWAPAAEGEGTNG